jgi:hypothetical protein
MHRFISLEKKDPAEMDRDDWLKIQEELKRLYELHESEISHPGKCREFNSQVSLFLQKLEDLQVNDLADRVMELLAGCSPKDFSPCENRQYTKASLERLASRIREKIEKS